MKKIFVTPRKLTEVEKGMFEDPPKCAVVRKRVEEGGALLKTEGEYVIPSSYWTRRIKAGDVILGKEQSAVVEKMVVTDVTEKVKAKK